MTTILRPGTWCLGALFAAGLAAQDSRATPATERVLARVIAKKINPLLFAGPKSPNYVDELVEGDVVVVVGPATGEYRQVVLPLGPTGYVSKKYCTEPSQGLVKTIGTNVSYRYRVPKAVEVPVDRLPKDADLHVLGEDGEWWIVRSPSTPAYVASKDLTILPGEPAAAEAALKATEQRRQGEWSEAAAKFAKAQEEAKATSERRTKLDALQRRIADETKKATESQQYDQLKKELDELAAALPASSDEAVRATLLQKEIQKQVAVLEVVKIKNEPPVKVTPSEDIRRDVPDTLGSRVNAIGWLRARRGNPAWEIEKGGVVLYLVACTTGRYDLTMFEGSEIAIVGNVDRPTRDSVRVLDAQGIEVIAPRRR